LCISRGEASKDECTQHLGANTYIAEQVYAVGAQVERLRISQRNCENLFHEKVDIEALGNSPQLFPLRKDIEYGIETILVLVDSEAAKNPQQYEALVNELNGRINAIMTIVRARVKRKRTRRLRGSRKRSCLVKRPDDDIDEVMP
jgi:hypothetical protein